MAEKSPGRSATVTGFYARIYALARTVPPGKVTTYGALAAAAGKLNGARQAGQAMARNPAVGGAPAHRVVNQKGQLSPPHIFGPGIQRALLEGEGVFFLPDGRIDMKRCFFRPAACAQPLPETEQSEEADGNGGENEKDSGVEEPESGNAEG